MIHGRASPCMPKLSTCLLCGTESNKCLSIIKEEDINGDVMHYGFTPDVQSFQQVCGGTSSFCKAVLLTACKVIVFYVADNLWCDYALQYLADDA